MRVVEQHIIRKGDPRYSKLDEAAFASKNLWNAANYLVRQSFIFQDTYLNNVEIFHQIKSHEAYQALPRKVSNQVLIQLHQAWKSFFEALAEWREHPEKFLGRPKLPKYKPKTEGRNVVEVVSERPAVQAEVSASLFASLDLGVTNLAAITSNKPGFVPLLVNGRVLKSINQGYNKQREHLQKQLARQDRLTSRRLKAVTDKRNRRIQYHLHLASKAILERLVSEGIGTLIIGKNVFWKQEVEMGKRNNQAFVQIPHARFIEMLQYKAALVGVRVILSEESYTSRASFLDRDPLPVYDPARKDEPKFSGRRKGRWYSASGKRVIHSDVNGSYNIARKAFSTAFDGPEIEAPAVRPIRLAVK